MAGLTSCENALLSVFTQVADIYANVLGPFSLEKSSTPTGLVWNTNMAPINGGSRGRVQGVRTPPPLG